MSGAENIDGGTDRDQMAQRREDLDGRLLQLSYGRAWSQSAGPALAHDRGAAHGSGERGGDSDPIGPSATARLAGNEVATTLDAAEVAAERIRTRAWEVAAEVQRQIRDMQGTLARLALEMSDLLRKAPRASGVTPPSKDSPTEDAELDLAVVLHERDEERSSTLGPLSPGK